LAQWFFIGIKKIMALIEITAPASEPITKAELELHLRLDSTSETEDELLDAIIASSREWVVSQTRRALVNTTFKITMDVFPSDGIISLPRSPLVSITSVKYYDTSGDQQTFSSDDYDLDLVSAPGRIGLSPSSSWPSIQSGRIAPIEIIFVAGYGVNATVVPESIKTAIKLLCGHLYENREDSRMEDVFGTNSYALTAARSLLGPYMVMT